MSIQFPDPNDPECRVISSVLARVGDKWSILIVVLLAQGPKRFSDIKRSVGGISQRMLTLTLRGLERDGLVNRKEVSALPLRVDYKLTPLGHSLGEAVEPLATWAQNHLRQISKARDKFDARADQ
jgi:DNA-binding HxlR family transcriptional regulator